MPSIYSVDDAYNNRMAERFFSTLEAELLSRRRLRPKQRHAWRASAPSRVNTTRQGCTRCLGHRSSMTYKAERKAALIEP